MYIYLVVLDLGCRRLYLQRVEGYSILAMPGLLMRCLLLLQSRGSRAHGLQWFWCLGSVVTHGLSCSLACGIFLHRGSNPCPLYWQADS